MLGLGVIGDLPLAGLPSPLSTVPIHGYIGQYDWPNARAPRLATDYRSWEAKYNRNLIGRDLFPRGRKQLTDLTVPDIRHLRRHAYSWEWWYNKNLFGKDKFNPGKQTFELPPRDYPRTAYRSWEAWYNKNLIGKDRLPTGKANFDLTPTGYTYPIDLRTWIESGQALSTGPVQIPFNQEDWPVPKGPDYSVQLRTWAWQYNPNLVAQDQFPSGEQNTARLQLEFRELRTWYWWYNLNLVGQDLVPGEQRLDLPPRDPREVRSWTWSYNLNLRGKDQLPFRQQDWPLTPSPAYSGSLRNWIGRLTLTVYIPFNRLDWPLPRPLTQPDRGFAQGSPLTLRQPPAQVNPFHQTDWPLPGVYLPLSQAQSYGTPLPLIPVTPPTKQVNEWIVRARRRKVR